MLRHRPNIIRAKRYGSTTKTTGFYKRNQIKFCEKSNRKSEGNFLIKMPSGFEIEVWDLTKSEKVYSLVSNPILIKTIKYTPDMKFILADCMSSSVLIWEWNSGNNPLIAKNVSDVLSFAYRDSKIIGFISNQNKAVVFNSEFQTCVEMSKKFILLLNHKRRIRMV